MKCKICNREFKNLQGLAYHLGRMKECTSEEYYKKYLKTDPKEGICKHCGSPTKFRNLVMGYFEFCSTQCSLSSSEVRDRKKRTCMERYGVDYSFQSAFCKEKIKETNMARYGVENPQQNSEIRKKTLQTTKEKYGSEVYSRTSRWRNQIKNTSILKFGANHWMKNSEVSEKVRNTNILRYGGPAPSCSSVVIDKMKQTYLMRYGHENYFSSTDYKTKSRVTCLRKYGAPTFISSDAGRKFLQMSILKKYSTDNVSKLEFVKQKLRIINLSNMYCRLMNSDRLKDLYEPQFSEDDYFGVTRRHTWKCKKCDTIFEDHLDNGHIPRCPKCYPKHVPTSNAEKEIFGFCRSYYTHTQTRNRDILNGKELDVYIQEINLAIEFNGLYWHSEINGCIHSYHVEKTNKCEAAGIQLIHIFEDEWRDKREIVESILKAKMRKIEKKIFARKCDIREVSSDDGEIFLINNHIQGPIRGSFIGLYYDEKLVSLVCYGKPRFDKNYDIEIYRFCSLIDCLVIGGLSKLLKYLIGNHPGVNLISYADRRFSNGNSYNKCGFQLDRVTSPGYFYLKDGDRINRMQFQKHLLKDKLKTFDPNLTEWQNMQLNGYDRIWDCGNLVFTRRS